MTNYVKATDFAVKDSLLTGNPSKLVRGTEINAEFAAIQVADATSIKGSGASTDNSIVRFDGIGGYTAQPSGVTIDDAGVVSGVASAAGPTDATNLSQVQNSTAHVIGSVSGTNTITGNLTPAITAYVAGQTFRFVAAGANTGAVTININGLGAKAVTKSGATALAGGDIPSGAAVQVFYDGTQFQLSSGAGGSSGANLLTQANGINVLAGTGQSLVGPITIPTGQNITVASGARLVIL